ncbi:CHAT domain-containing protein [Chitinophaga sancti]|uniref:CHAT domain-containing protein n=1 Tax=Chitinophaga sancti TaxID=1004 RepID=UPI002A75E10E|nr:CHAT domain-containing protein [Chitinophaga sancti]WPQ63303.1 CHAT domain-containing protein [Chitinophaga sancti]
MAVRVVLAFANDVDESLKCLQEESETVYPLLKRMDRQFVTPFLLKQVSAKDLRTEFADDSPLNVFHFSGHAGSLDLLLADGQVVNGEGVAKMLSKVSGLELVFLNGCATYGLVDAFHKAGAKIVIASKRKVFDKEAAEFSVAFYLRLSQLAEVGQAFDEAQAWLQTNKMKIADVDRSVLVTVEEEEDDFPFQIFYKPIVKAGNIIDKDLGSYRPYDKWKFQYQLAATVPYSPYLKILETIGNKGNDIAKYISSKTPHAKAEVSDFGLLQRNYNEFKKKPRTIFHAKELHERIGNLVPRPLATIMASMRANAISIQAGNMETYEDYWEDLLDFYELLVKFTCYVMVSDLFEIKYREGRKFVINSKVRNQLRQLLSLSRDDIQSFSYSSLIRETAELIRANGHSTFVEEYMTESFQIDTDDLNLAHNIIRLEKIRYQEGIASIPDHCRIVENELCNILDEVCFILRYNLLVVRNIEATRFRFNPKQVFIHSILELRHRQVRCGKEWDEKNDYSQNYSVILAKGLSSVMNYLSLSPFIIDKCLITGDEISQLYYYSHSEENKIIYKGEDKKDGEIIIEFIVVDEPDYVSGSGKIMKKTAIPYIEKIKDNLGGDSFDKEKAVNRLKVIYRQFKHLRTAVK